MNYELNKGFTKEFDKLKDEKVKVNLVTLINRIAEAHTLQDIVGLKQLKGYKTCYRVRKGDYRIVFLFQNETAFVMGFSHRKNVYKKFP